MKQLYLAIKAQLQAEVPGIKFIQMFNNQFEDLEAGEVYSFPMPAVFIEFESPNPVNQLGNGVQIIDPLIVKVHIADDFYNGSSQEQNLEIFDIKDSVYKALQKFEPNGAVAFIRSIEEQDYDHSNVYHFIQSYTTNYIDTLMIEPVNGQNIQPPFTLDLTVQFE